jgi:hypothetical protein
MRAIVQIVPGLPPAIDGVGDYALAIARALRERQEIESLFVVANPLSQTLGVIEGFPVTRVARKDPASLMSALRGILASGRAESTTPVLFHCSLYGYARRALAFWLQKGLVQWKQRAPEGPLITMFHELVADGPVWSSAFWLHGVQRGLIRRFAHASTASLTSNARCRQLLAEIAGIEESQIAKLAVLSNVGEPGELPPALTRKLQLVVFGRPNSRDLAFSRGLKSVCEAFGIERILEVGPDPSRRAHRLPAVVEATGALAAGEVSAILRDSRFGFIASDASLLSKSGVFAAYCAHGAVPIVAGADDGEADGLYANQQYLRAPLRPGIGGDQLEAVSQSARAWYRGHSVTDQAAVYAGILDRISETHRAGAGERLVIARRST